MTKHRIRCQSTTGHQRLGLILREDSRCTGRWFLGIPGAAVTFDRDQLIKLATAAVSLVDEHDRSVTNA